MEHTAASSGTLTTCTSHNVGTHSCWQWNPNNLYKSQCEDTKKRFIGFFPYQSFNPCLSYLAELTESRHGRFCRDSRYTGYKFTPVWDFLLYQCGVNEIGQVLKQVLENWNAGSLDNHSCALTTETLHYIVLDILYTI